MAKFVLIGGGDVGRGNTSYETYNIDKRIVELRHSIRIAAESKFENGTIDATDLLAKIADETSALLNQNIHELELLQTQYRLKTTLNQ